MEDQVFIQILSVGFLDLYYFWNILKISIDISKRMWQLKRMKTKIKKLNCLRCGHKWIPRKEDVRMCPKCKSPYFDQKKAKK